MTTPKKNDPLTVDEMKAAADIFMPLYKVVAKELPDPSVEDVLKVMESVAKLGHKMRTEKRLEESTKFGFNKEKTDDA